MTRKPTPGGAAAIANDLWEQHERRKALAVRDALSAELKRERLNRTYPSGALISVRNGPPSDRDERGRSAAPVSNGPVNAVADLRQ